MNGGQHDPDAKAHAPTLAGNGPIFSTLLLILFFKLLLLFVYGPIVMPDTGDYLAYAKTILDSTDWLHKADISSSPLPLAYRMIGFPAVLAASLTIGGPTWQYVVIALQFALSLCAGWMVYRLALELGLPWKAAIAAVIAFATSIQLTLDQTLLTDSIHASLVIIAVCLLSKGVGSGMPMRLGEVVLAGALLALAFLLRDAMQYLLVAFLPVLAARMLATRNGGLRNVAICLALVMPVLATVEAYKTWNYYRTGERFVAPIGQLTVLYFLTRAAQFDPHVLDGDTPVEIVARRHVRDRDPKVLNLAYGVSYELFDRGYRSNDIAKSSYTLYFKSWRDHPHAMFGVIREHVSERLLKLAFRPLTSVCQTIEWATKAKPCPDERLLLRSALSGFAGEDPSVPVLLVLGSGERIISIGVSLAFVLGVPLMLVFDLRRRRLAVEPSVLLTAAYWAMTIGWTAAYAAVVMEERYLAPVVPFVIVSGLVVIQRMILVLRQTRLRPV